MTPRSPDLILLQSGAPAPLSADGARPALRQDEGKHSRSPLRPRPSRSPATVPLWLRDSPTRRPRRHPDFAGVNSSLSEPSPTNPHLPLSTSLPVCTLDQTRGRASRLGRICLAVFGPSAC